MTNLEFFNSVLIIGLIITFIAVYESAKRSGK